jgi:hypothetical protein
VRRAAVLPLIIIWQVKDIWFVALEENDDFSPEMTRFTDYVTETWVEGKLLELWNHFDNDRARTTNPNIPIIISVSKTTNFFIINGCSLQCFLTWLTNTSAVLDYMENGRGGHYLLHTGYKYSIKIRRAEGVYRRCVLRQCAATLITLKCIFHLELEWILNIISIIFKGKHPSPSHFEVKYLHNFKPILSKHL